MMVRRLDRPPRRWQLNRQGGRARLIGQGGNSMTDLIEAQPGSTPVSGA
jgi:hypothetical protein